MKPLLLVLCLAFAAPLLLTGPPRAQSEPAPQEVGETVTDKAAEETKIPVKQIKMLVENWKWSPRVIRVAQGTLVKIDFESRDASHAFVLKGYGLKVKLPQDRPAKVEFIADKKGEFKWRCGRPCGNGCPKMTGQLIVE